MNCWIAKSTIHGYQRFATYIDHFHLLLTNSGNTLQHLSIQTHVNESDNTCIDLSAFTALWSVDILASNYSIYGWCSQLYQLVLRASSQLTQLKSGNMALTDRLFEQLSLSPINELTLHSDYLWSTSWMVLYEWHYTTLNRWIHWTLSVTNLMNISVNQVVIVSNWHRYNYTTSILLPHMTMALNQCTIEHCHSNCCCHLHWHSIVAVICTRATTVIVQMLKPVCIIKLFGLDEFHSTV